MSSFLPSPVDATRRVYENGIVTSATFCVKLAMGDTDLKPRAMPVVEIERDGERAAGSW